MTKSEILAAFLVTLAGFHIMLFLLLPHGATGDALANLDAIQVQLLIDSYKEQLSLFKWAVVTVCGAETSAIIWLTKRLLDELKSKKRKN